MIPKEIKYNLHYVDVRGDFYGRHTAQHQQYAFTYWGLTAIEKKCKQQNVYVNVAILYTKILIKLFLRKKIENFKINSEFLSSAIHNSAEHKTSVFPITC